MKLLPTFLIIIISINVYLSSTTETDTEDDEEEGGVDASVINFHSYYSCYFNKYFNISSDQDNPRRDKVRRAEKYARAGLSVLAPVRGQLAGGGRQHQPEQPQYGLCVLDVLDLAGVEGVEARGRGGLGLPLPWPSYTGLG